MQFALVEAATTYYRRDLVCVPAGAVALPEPVTAELVGGKGTDTPSNSSKSKWLHMSLNLVLAGCALQAGLLEAT